jgi:hypothetical protein
MKGVSYTYFTTDNAKSARELISILKEAKATVPPQLEEMAMYGGGGGGRSELCDFCITQYTDMCRPIRWRRRWQRAWRWQ